MDPLTADELKTAVENIFTSILEDSHKRLREDGTFAGLFEAIPAGAMAALPGAISELVRVASKAFFAFYDAVKSANPEMSPDAGNNLWRIIPLIPWLKRKLADGFSDSQGHCCSVDKAALVLAELVTDAIRGGSQLLSVVPRRTDGFVLHVLEDGRLATDVKFLTDADKTALEELFHASFDVPGSWRVFLTPVPRAKYKKPADRA